MLLCNVNDEIKIRKRVEKAHEYIDVVNPPRPGKKLLMLDIDYTFFDHRSPAEHALQLRRPYLLEFLASVYRFYDIGIWSVGRCATSKQWIVLKLQQLEVSGHPLFKISVILDARAMISTWSAKKQQNVKVKPLEVVYRYAQLRGVSNYSPGNTIMFDDLSRNFLLNPQQGLKIRPFRNALVNGQADEELRKLERYLLLIKDCASFAGLNHRKWEKYLSGEKSIGCEEGSTKRQRTKE
eukprot:g2323.t1